jgi:hypothetical protein
MPKRHIKELDGRRQTIRRRLAQGKPGLVSTGGSMINIVQTGHKRKFHLNHPRCTAIRHTSTQ